MARENSGNGGGDRVGDVARAGDDVAARLEVAAGKRRRRYGRKNGRGILAPHVLHVPAIKAPGLQRKHPSICQPRVSYETSHTLIQANLGSRTHHLCGNRTDFITRR